MMNLLKTAVIPAVVFSLAGCAQPQRPDFAEISARYEANKLAYAHDPYVTTDLKTIKVLDEDEYAISKVELQQVVNQRNTLAEKYRLIQIELRLAAEANNRHVDALIECEYGKAQREEIVRYQDDQAWREQIISTGKQLLLVGACGLLLH